MKKLSLILLLCLTTKLCFAQSIDFALIKYNNLNFRSTKSEIIKKNGKPKKIYNPNYECGFLSSSSQDREYITLYYNNVKFTGNKKELYVLEQVNFENDNSIIIKYANQNLTSETTLSELIKIFGNRVTKHFAKKLDGSIIIFQKNADDGIRISIKNGKLIRFEYWSPC